MPRGSPPVRVDEREARRPVRVEEREARRPVRVEEREARLETPTPRHPFDRIEHHLRKETPTA